ncbi:MAG: Ig-like domain-containing protein, partial [Lachnospiraceae bacterium]|nr:Ig-like domain-containing protein [Lachnospiraceae bacterium]
ESKDDQSKDDQSKDDSGTDKKDSETDNKDAKEQSNITVKVAGFTGTYDGKAHSITVTLENAGSDVKVYYSTKQALTAENYATEGNTTNPSATDAGKTTVYYYVHDGGKEVTGGAGSSDIVINKAVLTITAKETYIVVGAAVAGTGVDYAGFVNGENESKLTGTLAYDSNYAQYGPEGEYTITPKGLASVNYDIKYVAGKLYVLPNTQLYEGLSATQEGKKLKLTWGKVDGADGYDIYVCYCGGTLPSKPTKTVSGLEKVKIKKLLGKKLNVKDKFKIRIVAWKDVNGEKTELARTLIAHVVAAKNKEYVNVKKLTIKNSEIALATGASEKIKAKAKLTKKNGKQLDDEHGRDFRYLSSNPYVATVDKKGNVTGLKSGECVIYVLTRNFIVKKVTVKVQ